MRTIFGIYDCGKHRGALSMITGAVLVGSGLPSTDAAAQRVHDIVYLGARVIDPETHLDAVRTIAVDGDRITAVAKGRLLGRRVIDARSLIAAPGFIDIHSHASNDETARYQAKDGVTTRLELEIGTYPVKAWYAARQGHQLLNYGTSVGHTAIRYFLQKGGGAAGLAALKDPEQKFIAPEAGQAIPESAYDQLVPLLGQGLREGAIGIGSGTQYAPGITRQEMLDVTSVAGRAHRCLFTHIRFGSLVAPGSTLEAMQEIIANATITGACVHVAHINSMAMSGAPAMVKIMRDARSH